TVGAHAISHRGGGPRERTRGPMTPGRVLDEPLRIELRRLLESIPPGRRRPSCSFAGPVAAEFNVDQAELVTGAATAGPRARRRRPRGPRRSARLWIRAAVRPQNCPLTPTITPSLDAELAGMNDDVEIGRTKK